MDVVTDSISIGSSAARDKSQDCSIVRGRHRFLDSLVGLSSSVMLGSPSVPLLTTYSSTADMEAVEPVRIDFDEAGECRNDGTKRSKALETLPGGELVDDLRLLVAEKDETDRPVVE